MSSSSISRQAIALISSAIAALVVLGLLGDRAAADEPILGNPLIAIPAGPFVFGSDTGNENERPRRIVEGEAFAMNRTEISNAEYQRLLLRPVTARHFMADIRS